MYLYMPLSKESLISVGSGPQFRSCLSIQTDQLRFELLV